MKRTPLKRKKNWNPPRKPLRYRSEKTAEKYRKERVPLVEELFRDSPICEFKGCSQLATDPHEILSRGRGGSITDRWNVLVLCRSHHTFVTDNSLLAECLGLTLPSRATLEIALEASKLRSQPGIPSWLHPLDRENATAQLRKYGFS